MRRIHQEYGDVLHQVTRQFSLPPEFLAALIANESNGRMDAQRFEPHVLNRLLLAVRGKKEFRDPSLIRPIPQEEWLRVADRAIGRREPGSSFFAAGLKEMERLATSWGPTQMMGWHSVDWSYPIGELLEKQLHFIHARKLLEWGCQKYDLFPNKDFEAMLRFWNTGYPAGRKTYDPDYVPNGLRRMAIYEEVTQNA